MKYMIDACTIYAGILEYLTNNIHSGLTLVALDFDKSAFSIIFQKKWLCQQELDVNILSLRESGTLNNLKDKWFQTSYCFKLSEVSTAMAIELMACLFLTFGVISILANMRWSDILTFKDNVMLFCLISAYLIKYIEKWKISFLLLCSQY